MERTLTQEEIDAVFSATGTGEELRVPVLYNFGRSDRIPKPQVKAIQNLYENFARDLTIAFSAYLRDYVVINIISVEQIAYAEFLESLPSPTCLVSMRVQPFGELSVLELSPSVCSAVVEILMGGHAKQPTQLNRKLTEIEQSVLDGLIRLILTNLKAAWRTVHEVDFEVDSQESDPQVFRVLAPNDGVVAVAIEVRVGENVGMMNIGMNSLTATRLREKFDHNKSYKKVAGEEEQLERLRLFQRSLLEVEAFLPGAPLNVQDLLDLEVGDIVILDVPMDASADLLFNQRAKFRGQVVSTGIKRGFLVESRVDQDTDSVPRNRRADVQRGFAAEAASPGTEPAEDTEPQPAT